jgi:hypothetical protein
MTSDLSNRTKTNISNSGVLSNKAHKIKETVDKKCDPTVPHEVIIEEWKIKVVQIMNIKPRVPMKKKCVGSIVTLEQ